MLYLYCVNTYGKMHMYFFNWGHSLCKTFSSSIFKTSAFVFMGSVHITVKQHKIVLTLLSTEVDIDRERQANYETI